MKKVKSISLAILPLGAAIVNIFGRIFSFIENKFEAEMALFCFSFAFSCDIIKVECEIYPWRPRGRSNSSLSCCDTQHAAKLCVGVPVDNIHGRLAARVSTNPRLFLL